MLIAHAADNDDDGNKEVKSGGHRGLGRERDNGPQVHATPPLTPPLFSLTNWDRTCWCVVVVIITIVIKFLACIAFSCVDTFGILSLLRMQWQSTVKEKTGLGARGWRSAGSLTEVDRELINWATVTWGWWSSCCSQQERLGTRIKDQESSIRIKHQEQ